ncbi:MAG: hypothetical protein NTV24_01990 [Candidatus Woesebacteria bacterium]|nr:hypothetical protein [Candidatus Woesebacteria bacterium]
MALTKSDLKKIEELLNGQDIRFSGKLDDFEVKIEAKLYKFRSEFFEKIDPILKEVTTAREERPLIENRIEALEEIHQTGTHSLATI